MRVRSRYALVGALAGMVALALVWAATFHVAFVHWMDASTLRGFVSLDTGWLKPLAELITHSLDLLPYMLAGAVLVGVALARRRFRSAVVVPLVLGGAALSSQILKPLLADPRFAPWMAGDQLPAASWPSGHATAAMALALCAIIVAPPRLRPIVAALGGGYAVVMGYALLIAAWHYPSDVIGGYLLAMVWVGAGVAVLEATRDGLPVPRPQRAAQTIRDALAPMCLTVLGAAVVVGAFALVRLDHVLDFASAHTTFVAGALSVGALGLTIAGSVAIALRR